MRKLRDSPGPSWGVCPGFTISYKVRRASMENGSCPVSCWVSLRGMILVCQTRYFQTFLEKGGIEPTWAVHTSGWQAQLGSPTQYRINILFNQDILVSFLLMWKKKHWIKKQRWGLGVWKKKAAALGQSLQPSSVGEPQWEEGIHLQSGAEKWI